MYNLNEIVWIKLKPDLTFMKLGPDHLVGLANG